MTFVYLYQITNKLAVYLIFYENCENVRQK